MAQAMKQEEVSNTAYDHNYPSKRNHQLQFTQRENSPLNWLTPPVFSVPDWSPQKDAYATSPISSPGTYTPARSDSWSYFDTSFKEVETSPLTAPMTPMTPSLGNTFGGQAPWNPVWSPGLDSTRSFECLPLSLIQDSRYMEDQGRDEKMGLEEQEGEAGNEEGVSMHAYSHSRSSTCTFEEPSTPRKANWGTAAQARRNSGARRNSIRPSTRKESSKATTKSTRQLRSTTIPKRNSSISISKSKPHVNSNPSSIPSLSSSPASSARASHNAVEKEYRTRLNNQFSILLDALPPDIIDVQAQSGYLNEKEREMEKERKISKGEVLILARQYIENLERTKERLERERKALLANVERLKDAWLAVQSRDGDIR